ncbi:MAG: hypothetical protein M1816_006912 [Peltula sp. TS41687]|nr:MAG: hypothetical protein M1816_006912 [Peltula sp. TS41687]
MSSDSTLPLIWAAAVLNFLIMFIRLAVRKWKRSGLDTGDLMTIGLIVLNFAHASTIHIVITGPKDGMTEAYRRVHNISVEEAHTRELKSKLLLLGRMEILTYLWGQKVLLFVFYRGLIRRLRWERAILRTFWSAFALSYLAVALATFLECRPLSRFWIVFELGHENLCGRGVVQLYVQGGFNIATDIMLIALPFHVLFQAQRSFVQKLQLGILFLLGIFCILTTVLRLQQNSAHKLSQANRTTWANAELIASTFVASAPTMYVALHPRNRHMPEAARQIHVQRSFVVSSDRSKEGSDDMELGTEVEIWTPEGR